MVVFGRDEALRSLRVSDGAKESVQTEVVRFPSRSFTGFEVTTFAPDTHALESPDHVPIDLVEFVRGVSGAEVLTPAAQYGIELGDHIARVHVTA